MKETPFLSHESWHQVFVRNDPHRKELLLLLLLLARGLKGVVEVPDAILLLLRTVSTVHVHRQRSTHRQREGGTEGGIDGKGQPEQKKTLNSRASKHG